MDVKLTRICLLAVVPMKIVVFWDVTPYSLVAPHQCFGVVEYFFGNLNHEVAGLHGVTSRKMRSRVQKFPA